MDGLRHHKLDHIRGKSFFKCKLCPQSFTRKPHLQIHEETHRKNPYMCPYMEICLKAGKKGNAIFFPTSEGLQRHIKKHHGDREKTHQCEECKEWFVSQSALGHHAKAHAKDLIPCELCSKGFLKYLNLQSHMKQVHKLKSTLEELKGGDKDESAYP